MKIFLTIFLTFFICLCYVSKSESTIQVTPDKTKTKYVRNFMNETIAIIKKFEKSTKTLSANISIRQKVAGVTDFVNQDCHIEYQKPGYLKMNFKGLYPYTVIVSNGEVHTTIENEEDIRPLSPDENIFEHFLGIGYFKDIKKYNMRFRTEGDLYILKGEMPIKYLFSMQKDVIANAYKTIFMEIWLNPITGKIEKSHVKSFGGRDITYTYREQWINKKEKKKKRRQKDVSQKNENKL